MKKHLKIHRILSTIATFVTVCSIECFAATTQNVMKGNSLLIKFFISMLGVLLSALAIWLGLKLYKKFILEKNSKLDNIDYDTTLESPNDFKEAINLFLYKTDR